MTLYHHSQAKDNCGFGLIAHLEGVPSHKIVRTAISGLARMQHRGGISADGKTGDGCGLLLQKPDSFFQALALENNWQLAKQYGVGMFFFSQDPIKTAQAKAFIEQQVQREFLTLVAWRTVPIDSSVLGPLALSSMPNIVQLIVNAPAGWSEHDLERRLYMLRRRVEKHLFDDNEFYIASLSSLVIVFKGLMMPVDLPHYYLDLADIRLQTAICLFHQRFSTNTLPRWPLAQPFRFLAHNGEINTITGNRQWARARQYKFRSPLLHDLQDAAPFVSQTGSDSSSLDNMLELLLAGGMDLFRAMRLLVPPAWQSNKVMDDNLKAFYEFNSMHMEPWDGPAGIVLTNGKHVACNLDRNGLRPARYVITRDKLITLASEVGIWDYTPDEVVSKGRVGPGEMLAIDTSSGKIWHSDDIDKELMQRHPYRQWLNNHVQRLVPYEEYETDLIGQRLFTDDTMKIYHKLFNYSYEEIEQIITVLAKDGQEAVGSMGDDTPMAVLSRQPRSFFDYFRQQFAQVTNPAIDPLREAHVMSLATSIGREQNVFTETAGYARRIQFASPILMYSDLKQLKQADENHYRQQKFSLNFAPSQQDLAQAIAQLTSNVINAVREQQVVVIILSDRDIDPEQLPIPVAMAVGAVQQALVQEQLRCDANIIVETAAARDSHHFAVLLGLGATAIYPFMAYETVEQLVNKGQINLEARQAVLNYRKGINKGLYKIMSKMGISTIASYRCASLFEIIGLAEDVMQLCFSDLLSRISGASFLHIEQDLQQLAKQAWLKRKAVNHGGLLKYVHDGEYHAYNPDVVLSLQKAVYSGRYEDYQRYSQLVNERPITHLRDLFSIKPSHEPIALDTVESATSLYRRFDSAAMSIGALSPEAHEALAIAMNRLGGRSNSGEGGEDPRRFATEKNSKIKQVASGRFGVTAHYLVNAEVIQIKLAQGAKPGEGGQLPGEKVTAEIARLRYSVPGVTLISPPPHHDIYSIEDLAQLIFDLKQVNPKALVSVKLVSEPGIGTIATGVAKAYADLITVSGYDGGTGASPQSSVKYAGSPWELGLAEVHQALVENGLRDRIRLQVDGGLKTGLDVVKAAILGAESFGFGTGPMVALGCKFLRICHLNNCATGVATQDETLRRDHFTGLPERVMNYFSFIAEETRQLMAQLGVTELTQLIGRTDLLDIKAAETQKQARLNLTPILAASGVKSAQALFCVQNNTPLDQGKLNQLLLAKCEQMIRHKSGGHINLPIQNTDRSVGAALSGLIASIHGNQGMATHPIQLNFTGTAGQSFGVWNTGGLHMSLQGDANDYVGKGMTGGQLALYPHRGAQYAKPGFTIAGNTCLYGATGGYFYAAGSVGERFAVRNSGAIAVVEGCGDNGCEYMTGGVVVLLGATGINFGAGMTGGFAYLLDESADLELRLNAELVEALEVATPILQEHLRSLLHQHVEQTGSAKAQHILNNFSHYLAQFKLVKPKTSDVNTLLGHRARSSAELRVQAM
ncbi:glutamate synthase large subunit [Rheinheimera salexigens]|uniref:Glutamate synthase [NADPH] large chain n=1 Tax=Rheinheimera salexigens TaxID=1628148 RepID=A0A1E7Q536_9GAMM|nr:glutamate synthase large subunit [Rheinheimera salexigens]OEY69158.1 glutamate synthase large subunit [Rheinheimera salexigens]